MIKNKIEKIESDIRDLVNAIKYQAREEVAQALNEKSPSFADLIFDPLELRIGFLSYAKKHGWKEIDDSSKSVQIESKSGQEKGKS